MTNFKPQNPTIPLTIQHLENGDEWYEFIQCPSHIHLNGTTISDQYLTGRVNQHGVVLSNVHHRVVAHSGLLFKLRRTMSAAGNSDWTEWKLLWVAPMSDDERALVDSMKAEVNNNEF